MNFNKNDGVALVLVMSLMVLGGILIPVLMRSTETHIDVAQHKESMSKSFYSADSGVEFVKANSKEIFNKIESSEDNNYINFDSSGEIKFQSDSKWFVFGENNEIKFKIKLEDKDSKKFKSIGKYKGSEKEITFSLKSKKGKFPNLDHSLFAAGNEETAVELSGSSSIEGNLGTNATDFEKIKITGSSTVTGYIALNKEKEIKDDTWDKDKVYNSGDEVWFDGTKYTAQWYTKGDQPDNSDVWQGPIQNFDGNIEYTDKVEYPKPGFPDFPKDLFIKDSIKLSGNKDATISNNGEYESIDVGSNLTLKIDMNYGDRVIKVDHFDIGQGHIELINKDEDSKLTIYVEETLNLGGSSTLNLEGNPKNVVINYAGDDEIKFTGNTKFVGNLNIKSADLEIAGSNAIEGNVTSGGQNIKVTGAAGSIGVIYAPKSYLSLSGSGKLKGTAVVNNAKLEGNTKISYAPPPEDNNIPGGTSGSNNASVKVIDWHQE